MTTDKHLIPNIAWLVLLPTGTIIQTMHLPLRVTSTVRSRWNLVLKSPEGAWSWVSLGERNHSNICSLGPSIGTLFASAAFCFPRYSTDCGSYWLGTHRPVFPMLTVVRGGSEDYMQERVPSLTAYVPVSASFLQQAVVKPSRGTFASGLAWKMSSQEWWWIYLLFFLKKKKSFLRLFR